jgi:hypothetical protein
MTVATALLNVFVICILKPVRGLIHQNVRGRLKTGCIANLQYSRVAAILFTAAIIAFDIVTIPGPWKPPVPGKSLRPLFSCFPGRKQ